MIWNLEMRLHEMVGHGNYGHSWICIITFLQQTVRQRETGEQWDTKTEVGFRRELLERQKERAEWGPPAESGGSNKQLWIAESPRSAPIM